MSINRIKAVKKNLKNTIEAAAEQFVMADFSDLSVLETIAEALMEISREFGDDFPRSSAAAMSAGNILRKSTGNNHDLSKADIQAVENTISSLQLLIDKEMEDHEVDFPDSFTLHSTFSSKDNSATDQFNCLPLGVDQEILEEYLAHQEMMVSEIEDLVLAYEQNPNSHLLEELKRILHTSKGEAGVIGFNRIEKMCHQVEDYIQEKKSNLQADLLLEFKDWFEQTIIAVKNKTRLPESDNLLTALQDMSDSEANVTVSTQRKDTFNAKTDEEHDEFLEFLVPVTIEDPEITAEFISETIEHFEISDENLMILEKDPENEEAIASIFRAFHTIKGTTSFLGLTPLSELAHKAENLLDEVRKKRLSFEGIVVDTTFNAFDLIKNMIKDLEEALLEGKQFVPGPGLPPVLAQLKRAMAGEQTPDGKKDEKPGLVVVDDPKAANEISEPCLPEEETSGNKKGSSGGGENSSANFSKTVKQTMKIDADRIDLLLETIGELVIVESIVSREVAMHPNELRDMERNLAQLTKITRSLQDMGMYMRLIPIDTTFRKMSRLVRDLCKKTGKKIELIMEGKDTELDKSMVEKLGDPLVHMIRNAVDHGIEDTAEQRIAAGKDPVGKIILKAYHQGGNIHIDIQDDGRGLDKEIIAAKAIDRGIISSTENMSDEDIFALIFESGFSTAKKVTDVSGRGVGMDVVKNNIESVRGNVRIASVPGEGSTFTLVLPLTMAIIDGMILRVGSERYILPLLSIIESFQPSKTMISTISGKGEIVPFRNRLLPMFRLAELYDIDDAQTDPTKALVVVIEDTGRQVALLVDELLGQNQAVIKNLGEGIGIVEGIAGASIMPDGKPGLIIDVNGLIKLAMSSEQRATSNEQTLLIEHRPRLSWHN